MAQVRFYTCVLLSSAMAGLGCSGASSGGEHASAGSSGTVVLGSSGGGSGGAFGGTKSQSSGGTAAVVSGGTTSVAAYTEPVDNVSLDEIPTSVPHVGLEVASSALAQLEADPFDGPNVTGAFLDASSVRYDPVDVNYRGAYALQSLIQYGNGQRNWKVKFAKDHKYQARREWNYTFEQHVREKLSYDLMRFAGVKVPSAHHVRLSVNGTVSGAYLEYEDPDNKDWIADKFGDDSGDLFKGGYDLPNQPRYFATLEYLGDVDADYEMHYRKMTNNDDPIKAADYSSLKSFLKGLNQTEDSGFEAFLRANFDTEKFISYLVVANFISHWDSYPQRPKNFWLYNIPAAGRWVFIPWDMDGTFQPTKGYLNPMGTDESIFNQFDSFTDYEGRHPEEGTARPLVTKMMKVPAFRSAYVARYRQALTTFLEQNYLLDRVDALVALIAGEIPAADKTGFNENAADVKRFIQERVRNVTAELATLP
jgi:spore coat protein CotH